MKKTKTLMETIETFYQAVQVSPLLAFLVGLIIGLLLK